MIVESEILSRLFKLLPSLSAMHSPKSRFHYFCSLVVRKEIERLFKNDYEVNFGPFGELIFPYHSMGNIDSLNLFDLDEIMIFSYYWQNRNRYKKVLDIGANLGLHTILLIKCGFDVKSYEPAKEHYNIIKNNLELNNISNSEVKNVAVSNIQGETEFIVVKGNTTGSHIVGSKENPYGELEKYTVPLLAFKDLIMGVDFVKMDVEGHEKEIICDTDPELLRGLEIMLSIHDEINAKAIFDYFSLHKINMFSQKINWNRVESFDDMTFTHHDGTLFVTPNNEMNWMTTNG